MCEYITGYIDLYFQRHDEKAVTCEEDFFAAKRDANNADFANFLQYFFFFFANKISCNTSIGVMSCEGSCFHTTKDLQC